MIMIIKIKYKESKMAYIRILMFLCLGLLMGCTSLQSLTSPEVSLMAITPKSDGGLTPKFTLKLNVTNPNDQDLDIAGVSFALSIDDQKVLSGVTNQIPVLKAYSETPIEVEASISLFKLFALATSLTSKSNKDSTYKLTTIIDPRGFLKFNITNEGLLNEDLLAGFLSKPVN